MDSADKKEEVCVTQKESTTCHFLHFFFFFFKLFTPTKWVHLQVFVFSTKTKIKNTFIFSHGTFFSNNPSTVVWDYNVLDSTIV